jgi:hypothetical protein
MAKFRSNNKQQQPTSKKVAATTRAGPAHHKASDSLISFDTWDYSAADTCTETSAGGGASIASLSSFLVDDVFDDEENDFTLTSMSTTTPMVQMMGAAGETTTTETATDDDNDVERLVVRRPQQQQQQQQQKQDPEPTTVQVSVSGVIFSLKASTFAQLHGLPWSWRQDPPHNNKNDGGGFVGHRLDTSPVLFDLLLNHILFGRLPVLPDLSTVDAEELELLASLLRLEKLRQHLDRKLHPPNFAFLRRSSSSNNSSSRSLNDTSAGALHPSHHQNHFAFLKRSVSASCSRGTSYSRSSRGTGSSTSNSRTTTTTTNTTTGRRCLVDTSPGASPVTLVRKRLVDKSRAILRPSTVPRHHHRQLSQEQLCAISDQLQ